MDAKPGKEAKESGRPTNARSNDGRPQEKERSKKTAAD